MRFKVGDRVRVVKDFTNVYGGRCGVVEDMFEFAGLVSEVDDVGEYFYILSVDDNEWYWNDNMVEAIEEEI